ncbi:MAG: GNAT family N-acetyltransferase [Kofleriaceae bacterium]|nr:GNAT family N-acetyltransferase [Kofleriaceae bacterium]
MIRRATQADHPWIAQLATEVYRDLGDYGQVMPQWLVQPGVLAWLDEDAGQRRGFAVLGFYVDRQLARTVADLLAIGVGPRHQRGGIGTQLLEHVISVVAAVAPAHGIVDVRLTVADTNLVGQRWYAKSGFHVVDGDHGHYANGQRAIRMARPLAPTTASAPEHAPA